MNNLDTAIAALRPTKGARRPKGRVFTLTTGQRSSILQGPRGNTVATFQGCAEVCVAAAKDHVARFPGATLQVY